MSKKKLLEALKRATRDKCFGLAKILYTNKDVFGDEDEHELYFFIFDGFGYCPNYEGKVYMIKDLPRLQYFKDHKEEADDILTEFNIKEINEITPFMIAKFYGHITCEGNTSEEDLNINYEEEDKLLELEEISSNDATINSKKVIELT